MSVIVQEAQPGDAGLVKAFMAHVIAASVTQDAALLADLQANVEGNVDWWLAHPDDALHLKAVTEGGHLVGVVLVKRFWNLCSLFVEPRLQGRGVGRALLEAAIPQCRGRSPKSAIWLNAAPGAIAFYRRLGFVERAATTPLPPGFLALQRPL
jgi:GNAT superfamily N-acetyltransferase